MGRHEKGYVPATANRLPIELEFYFAIPDKYKAFEFEKYLKTGSGRQFTKKTLSKRKLITHTNYNNLDQMVPVFIPSVYLNLT